MIENKKWPELNLDLNKMLIEHPYGDVLSDVELLASANSGSDVESFIEKQKSNTPDYSILQCSEYAIKQDESWQDASTVLDLLYEYIK